MRSLRPRFTYVPGTVYQRVAIDQFEAGAWNVDVILGVQGAITTATMLARRTSDQAALLTFSSTIASVPQNPFRNPAQRLTLASPTEIEFVVRSSSPNMGAAFVDDIRIANAQLQMWANNVRVLLGDVLLSNSLSVTLQPGGGALIGLSPTGGQFFMMSIRSNDGLTNEILKCTGRSGDVLTVQRGQEGTSARTWGVVGNSVTIAVTAASLSALQAAT